MSSLSRIWAAVGQQLRNPSGLGGSVIGRLMAIANRQSNAIAIRALEIAANDTILELGVGPGRAVATLTAMLTHGRVLGIDHSTTMLAQDARHNRRAILEGRVWLLRGRFDALPCRTRSINKILAVHVIYFTGVMEIREARRVLRPGGSLAIFVIDKSAMTRWKFTESTSHRLFDQAELCKVLSLGGFASNEFTVSRIVLKFGIPGLLAVATKQGEESLERTQSVAPDPKRHFATVNCRIAKDSFALDVLCLGKAKFAKRRAMEYRPANRST